MPLTPYLKGAVFDPQAIEAMNRAFEALCKSLQLTDRTDKQAEIVARKVIDLGRAGERDPQRIHDRVLLDVNASGQKSA